MDENEILARQPTQAPGDPSRTTLRPSVLHLIIWTTFSALYLGIERFLNSMQDLEGLPDNYRTAQHIYSVVHAITIGASLTGSILLVWERVQRGPPLARQGGHWLLLVPAVLVCLYMPVATIVLTFYGSDVQYSIGTGNWYFVLLSGMYLAAPILYGIATWQSKSWRWRIVFFGLALLGLAQCIFYVVVGLDSTAGMYFDWVSLLSTMTQWGNLVLTCVILLVATGERAMGIRGDWLHWAGVLTNTITTSAIMIWILVL